MPRKYSSEEFEKDIAKLKFSAIRTYSSAKSKQRVAIETRERLISPVNVERNFRYQTGIEVWFIECHQTLPGAGQCKASCNGDSRDLFYFAGFYSRHYICVARERKYRR